MDYESLPGQNVCSNIAGGWGRVKGVVFAGVNGGRAGAPPRRRQGSAAPPADAEGRPHPRPLSQGERRGRACGAQGTTCRAPTRRRAARGWSRRGDRHSCADARSDEACATSLVRAVCPSERPNPWRQVERRGGGSQCRNLIGVVVPERIGVDTWEKPLYILPGFGNGFPE